MTRSPNYGTRRGPGRPKHTRELYLVGLQRFPDRVEVTVEGPRHPPFTVLARDDTSAITKVELLRRGAWMLPTRG